MAKPVIALEDIVACVDCKYYVRTFGMWLTQEDARCSHGYNPDINFVTGKVEPLRIHMLDKCKRERTDDYSQNCGPKGKYWSPRAHTPANTFRLLKRTGNGTNETE